MTGGRGTAWSWSDEVAEAFGLGRPLGPAAEAERGRQGVVHRLVTDRGSWAVKELLLPLAESAAALDGTLTEVMADRGVLAPRPARTAQARFLARVAGRTVRVSGWLDLAGSSTALDPVALGMLFGTVHRDPLQGKDLGLDAPAAPDPWFTDAVSGADWEALVGDLRSAGCPFADDLARAADRHLRLAAVFRPPVDVQLCHRDLWANNVRGTPDGALAVIDWDNCGPAEAVQEAAVALVEFCRHAPDRVAAFADAYLRAGGPALPRDRSDFTMVLAQFGHFVETAGRWWLEAVSDREREDAEAWFREDHDDPVDLDTLDDLLSALASTR